jgi:hypothetical protein
MNSVIIFIFLTNHLMVTSQGLNMLCVEKLKLFLCDSKLFIFSLGQVSWRAVEATYVSYATTAA